MATNDARDWDAIVADARFSESGVAQPHPYPKAVKAAAHQVLDAEAAKRVAATRAMAPDDAALAAKAMEDQAPLDTPEHRSAGVQIGRPLSRPAWAATSVNTP